MVWPFHSEVWVFLYSSALVSEGFSPFFPISNRFPFISMFKSENKTDFITVRTRFGPGSSISSQKDHLFRPGHTAKFATELEIECIHWQNKIKNLPVEMKQYFPPSFIFLICSKIDRITKRSGTNMNLNKIYIFIYI